jgi:hypothetical protein
MGTKKTDRSAKDEQKAENEGGAVPKPRKKPPRKQPDKLRARG